MFATGISTTCVEAISKLKMASAQVLETSVAVVVLLRTRITQRIFFNQGIFESVKKISHAFVVSLLINYLRLTRYIGDRVTSERRDIPNGVGDMKLQIKKQTNRKKVQTGKMRRIPPLQGDSVWPLHRVTIKFKALIGIMAAGFVQQIYMRKCHLFYASMHQHVPDGTKQHFILTVNLEISVSARALAQLSNLHHAHLKYQMDEITRTLFYKDMENAPHYGLS